MYYVRYGWYFEGERKSCYGKTEEDCQGRLNVILGKIYLAIQLSKNRKARKANGHAGLMARCTKKDILLFSVIESIFSFINQESR